MCLAQGPQRSDAGERGENDHIYLFHYSETYLKGPPKNRRNISLKVTR